MTTIDLNADLGEGMPNDAGMMPFISSCNIACGGHAGDRETMRRTLKLAREHGVAAGAHPSYPDREGFGRRSLHLAVETLTETVKEQVRALRLEAEACGIALTHLKPHGALYNDAAKDEGLADVLVKVITELLPGARLVGPPGSKLAMAAEAARLPFVAEGFCDRSYQRDGSLTPRSQPGAMVEGPQARAEQALALAEGRAIETADGGQLNLSIQTICLHGDAEGAEATARAVRRLLEESGIKVEPIGGR